MGDTAASDPAVERRELMAAVLAAAGIRRGSRVVDFTPAAGLAAAAEAMSGAAPVSSGTNGGVTHALACPGLVPDAGGPTPTEVAAALAPGGRAVLVDRADALTDAVLSAAGLTIRWEGLLPWRGAEVRVVAAVRTAAST